MFEIDLRRFCKHLRALGGVQTAATSPVQVICTAQFDANYPDGSAWEEDAPLNSAHLLFRPQCSTFPLKKDGYGDRLALRLPVDVYVSRSLNGNKAGER